MLVDESVVKAPVDGVVAPIPVLFIPVEVVLKLDDVIVNALAPVLIDEAERPESVRLPDVAVRLSAPDVSVKPPPLVIISSPLIVTDPDPLRGESTIFPVVFPPSVRVLFAVVWIDRGAPDKVRFPAIDAFDVVVSAVNAPVDGVVAPIADELIPVAVVLKLLEVKVRAFDPVSIDEAENPDKFKLPEVAVKFNAPVVSVNPLLAVRRPATDWAVVKLLFCPLYATFDKVPVVLISVPLY